MTNQTVATPVADGSGKVHIVTEPPLPATCAVCIRSANGRVKFVDFNASLDYYGAIVICEDCIKEVLQHLDYVPREKLVKARDAGEQLVAKLIEAENELAKYKFIVDGLRSVGVISDSDGDEPENSNEAVGESESTDGKRLETESDSDGSDSGGGLKDLSIFAD